MSLLTSSSKNIILILGKESRIKKTRKWSDHRNHEKFENKNVLIYSVQLRYIHSLFLYMRYFVLVHDNNRNFTNLFDLRNVSTNVIE